MKAEFINPFLESLVNVLSTMAMTEASPGKPSLKKEQKAMGDVTGLIGMASDRAKGSLAITFSEAAIIDITKRMLGEEVKGVDETVTDVVGEITNMVCGGAKKTLAERGYDFDLAIPGVVTGKDHTITHKSAGAIIIVPFTTTAGKFYLEISFE